MKGEKPPGYVFGRPTEYRAEFCQIAIDYMSKGFSQTALAGHLGVSKETLFRWIREHKDFHDAISIAKPKRVEKLESDLLITEVPAVVNSRKFALLNADRDEWRDTQHIAGDRENPIAHVQMSREELEAALANRGLPPCIFQE